MTNSRTRMATGSRICHSRPNTAMASSYRATTRSTIQLRALVSKFSLRLSAAQIQLPVAARKKVDSNGRALTPSPLAGNLTATGTFSKQVFW
ncbi:hypothetical protein E1B28_011944 [Marasmius oreades]|uniref:Uncharacterized protein n=1 Tax=Marasmius oreades TaxID=181124 RepID=A0A9P7RQL7_9AGAR|nr:uncharacterized protein E1B28_011944 [Marasmius oreades]KAG7087897.1 hypothetical protein E1B28_011944 [Marasmius oreades]